MDKATLRSYFKNILIKNYSRLKSDITQKSIIIKVCRLIKELKITTVGLYYPLRYEINLLEIVNLQPNLEFSLPKIIENEISYYSYKLGDKLVLNNYSIYEPDVI